MNRQDLEETVIKGVESLHLEHEIRQRNNKKEAFVTNHDKSLVPSTRQGVKTSAFHYAYEIAFPGMALICRSPERMERVY